MKRSYAGGAMARYKRARTLNSYRPAMRYGAMVLRGSRAVYGAYNRYNSGSSSKASKYSRGYNGVTTQHDTANVYRKKRMPYGKKRKWRGFIKKVEAVGKRSLAGFTKVFNTSQETPAIAAPSQGVICCHLYGGDGLPTEIGANDVKNINSMVAGGSLVNGYTITNGTKYMFYSAIMDITFSNFRRPGGENPNPATRTLEVDMYDIIYSRGTGEDVQSLINAFTNGFNDTSQIQSGVDVPSIQDRGVTPFDIPAAIRFGRIKILSKKKYFLAEAQAATYQIRDPRNWTITPRNYNSEDFRTDHTRSILFIAKPVDPACDSQSLHLGVTRTYKWSIQNTRVSAYGALETDV